MTITIPGFDTSTKYPGVYLAEVFGGAATSPGDVATKTLIVGNMHGSALTGSTPSFSIAAGTAALVTPYQLFSPDDAKAYFGAGSELHRMAKAFFKVYPTGTLYGLATAQGSTASTGVITMTGTPTAALVARVFVNEDSVDVAIAASDSVTTIATAIATAINQQPDWPCTAQYSAGVVTLTAKHTGLRSANIQFRATLLNATTTAEAVAGSLAATLTGSTLTLSGGTAVSGAYCLTGGTTEETTTAALAAIVATRFHRIVIAQQTSTELARVAAQVDSMAAVGTQLRQQWVAGSTGTYAATVTLADAQQKVRGQIVWSYVNPCGPGEIAAAACAGRLYGDAQAGGSTVGEVSDANANLDGITLAGTKIARSVADRPTRTQMNSALGAGITPLEPTGTGLLRITRSVTTRSEDDAGNPNYTVLDTSIVTTLDYESDGLEADLAVKRAGKKLAPDASDGSGPTIANVWTPSIIRAAIHQRLKTAEAEGRLIDVDALAPQLTVVRDPDTAGRALASVPMRPTPGLHQIAVAVRQAP